MELPEEAAPIGHAEALEFLASKVWQKLEHLDPGDGSWGEIDEGTRLLFRQAVDYALSCAPRRVIEGFFNRTPATTK